MSGVTRNHLLCWRNLLCKFRTPHTSFSWLVLHAEVLKNSLLKVTAKQIVLTPVRAVKDGNWSGCKWKLRPISHFNLHRFWPCLTAFWLKCINGKAQTLKTNKFWEWQTGCRKFPRFPTLSSHRPCSQQSHFLSNKSTLNYKEYCNNTLPQKYNGRQRRAILWVWGQPWL